MKNILNISLIAVTLFISTYPLESMAERIRNMSLSVDETNRQLGTPQEPQSNYNNDTGLDDNMARQIDEINARRSAEDGFGFGNGGSSFDSGIPPAPRSNYYGSKNGVYKGKKMPPHAYNGRIRRSFINEFCSSDYDYNQGSTATQKNCIDTYRQQACERFSRATVDIQQILTQTIDCETGNDTLSAENCDGLDAARIDLLKQYWQDEDASYTILFLPDMVVNSADLCPKTNRLR